GLHEHIGRVRDLLHGLCYQSLGVRILLRAAERAHAVEQTGDELLFVWGHRGLLAIGHGADVRRRRGTARGVWHIVVSWDAAVEAPSEDGAAGSHRPDRLDARVLYLRATDADVPVVQIDRRIAVAGDQQQLLARLGSSFALGEIDDAMLIRRTMIF